MRHMTKSVGIIQSNYIPWKGYFDVIGLVDEFILLDNVQFTKNSWRNRNRLKTPRGPAWLTIPVKTGGRFGQSIEETEVVDSRWVAQHWTKWQTCYREAPFFSTYASRIEKFYAAAADLSRLSAINELFIKEICVILGITTKLTAARDYPSAGTKTDLVIALCQAAGASRYLSGPAARDYIETEKFVRANIELAYIDYTGYPEYRQPHGAFEHSVSVLDLIFCAGPDARRYMKIGTR
jgi:hypothetical protein